MSSSLYASLPDPPETSFSREMTDTISQVDVIVQHRFSSKRLWAEAM